MGFILGIKRSKISCMNTEVKIFKNTLYQILGKVVTSGLGILATAFLSRYLGTNLFGEYSLILSYVGFIALFADFGLSALLTREIAAERVSHEYFRHVFNLRFISAFVVLLFGVILVFFFPYNNLIKIGVIIASVGTFFTLLASIIWSYFQGKTEFKNIVYSQVGFSISSLILIIIGVYFKFSLLLFIFIFLLANFISLLVSLNLAKMKIFFTSISSKVYLKILSQSLYFAVWSAVIVIYFKIDALILSLFYNPSNYPDVGIYAIAYKIFETVIVFGGTFTTAMYPYFSKKIEDKNFILIFKKFLIYSFILSLLATISLLIFSKFLVLLIAGNNFRASINSLMILSLAAGFTIFAGFFLNIAAAAKKQISIAKFAIVALILNVGLNVIFIPKYSYIAASWITVFTQLFVLLSYIFISYRTLKNTL